jgi:hypothetical protein
VLEFIDNTKGKDEEIASFKKKVQELRASSVILSKEILGKLEV